jgi:hypothetical protein
MHGAAALAGATIWRMSSAPAAEHKAEHRARAEQAALAAVVQRLTSQFPEVPPETIRQAVRGEYDEYDNSAIRDFVPILVERAVRAELRHRA